MKPPSPTIRDADRAGFTPGPWFTSGSPPVRDPRIWIYAQVGPNRPRIAMVEAVFGVDEEAVAVNAANAALIAAAPALFEACRALVEMTTTAAPVQLVQRLDACLLKAAEALALAQPKADQGET